MAPKGRPPKKIEKWPFAPPPLAEPGTAGDRKSKLVDVLVNAGKGRLAQALARRRWPFLWDGPAESWTPDQRKAQEDASRDVVGIWVRAHARNLDWQMAILGSRGSNRLDDVKALATAHKNAARHIRRWASDPSDTDAAHRAAAAVDALPGDQSVPGERPLSPDLMKVTGETIHEATALASEFSADTAYTVHLHALMERVMSHADECDRVVKDIKRWRKENPAQGGPDLGSRKVAALVALFFNDGRKAAHEMGDPVEDLPKVAYADDQNHDPRNPYCYTVKSVLEVLGQRPDTWRYAAEAICKMQKKVATGEQ